jgi:hypothetical protein
VVAGCFNLVLGSRLKPFLVENGLLTPLFPLEKWFLCCHHVHSLSVHKCECLIGVWGSRRAF